MSLDPSVPATRPGESVHAAARVAKVALAEAWTKVSFDFCWLRPARICDNSLHFAVGCLDPSDLSSNIQYTLYMYIILLNYALSNAYTIYNIPSMHYVFLFLDRHMGPTLGSSHQPWRRCCEAEERHSRIKQLQQEICRQRSGCRT